MKGLKVEKDRAQMVKKKLEDHEALDSQYKVRTEGKYVIFPIKKDKNVEDGDIVDMTFEERDDTVPGTLKDHVKDDIPEDLHEYITKSYDVIGDIAIINLDKHVYEYKDVFAQAILETNKHIKTVLNKVGQHSGTFRTQEVECIGGEDRTETIHKENGVRLKLDVSNVYFSPRLSNERKRVSNEVCDGERVLIMFSGCGPYNIVIGKHNDVEKNVGVEVNPSGHEYALENKKLNKIEPSKFYLGDVLDVLPSFEDEFDRVVMPLPKTSEQYLSLAIETLRPDSTVHIYKFLSESEIEEFKEDILEHERAESIEHVEMCGDHAPGIHRYCFDVSIR